MSHYPYDILDEARMSTLTVLPAVLRWEAVCDIPFGPLAVITVSAEHIAEAERLARISAAKAYGREGVQVLRIGLAP
jgi:hypothetical protein